LTEFTTEFMSGTLYWAKVFKAVDNYERTGKEWTFNFIPDEDGIAVLKKHRLLDRLKEANDTVPGDFLVLRKPERNKDDEKNEPIKVKTADNEDWDISVNGLIGNGSKGDLRLTIADFGKGMKKAIWTNAIRVTDHIPHEGGTQSGDPFAEYKGSETKSPKKETKAKPAKAPLSELDGDDEDEIPF